MIDTEMDRNIKILDQLDLYKYINKGDDLSTIMDLVQDAYEDGVFDEWLTEETHEFLQGWILNHISDIDFANYLTNRYGTKWDEIIILRCWKKGEQ